MKPYSVDLRERVIKKVNDCRKYSDVPGMFRIGVATVRTWVKLQKEVGSVLPKKPTITKPRKVDYSKIQEYIEQNPDKTQVELSQHFGLSAKAMWYILKKPNITYKKTLLVRGEKGRFTRRIPKNTDKY